MPEFYLEYLSGERSGTSEHFTKPVVSVGRSDDCDLAFDEMGVSWEHAEFRHRDGNFWIIDRNSTNGTYVNDERAHNARLNCGDLLKFGKKGSLIRFSLQASALPISSSDNPVARSGKRKRRLPSEVDIPVPKLEEAFEQADPNRRHSDLPAAAPLFTGQQSRANTLLVVVPGLLLAACLLLLGVLYVENQKQGAQVLRAETRAAELERELEAERAGLKERLEAAREEGRAEEREVGAVEIERLKASLARAKRRAETGETRHAAQIKRLERETQRLRDELVRAQRNRSRIRVEPRGTDPSGDPVDTPGQVKSFKEIERNLSRSVVFIATRLEGKKRDGTRVELHTYGSGFFVSSQGHIITNKHVVQPWKFRKLAEKMAREGIESDEASYQIHVWRGGARFLDRGGELDLNSGYSTQNGTLRLVRVAEDRWHEFRCGGSGPRLIRIHDQNGNEDVALLQADASDVVPIPLGRSDSVEKLDEVLVLGFPAGPAILEAGVAETSPARGEVRKVEQTIFISAAMLAGNSGGPLVDRYGRAVGITTRVAKRSETLGSCLRIEHAKQLLYGGCW